MKQVNRVMINVSDKIPNQPLMKTECNVRMRDKETNSFYSLHTDVMSICEADNFWWVSDVNDKTPKESLKDG